MSSSNYNFIEYIIILNRWKKNIFLNVFVIITLAIILTLIMPKTYRASAVLMPPMTKSDMGLFSPFIDSPFGGLFSQTTDEETMKLIAILKSRTVLSSVIEKHDLVNFYQVDKIEEAILTLTNYVQINIDDEGTIRVSMDVVTSWFHPEEEEERGKQLSADIANYFIDQLDLVNKNFQTQQANFKRLFIEKRYERNIADLKKSEENLKHFQEINNMISLPEQTSAAIEAAANIKGHILAKEVHLSVLSKTFNPENPDINYLNNEISALKDQLKAMEYRDENRFYKKGNIFPTFSEVPELETQLRRLTREVEIQNTLFTYLTQQYEEAKINEAKDTPTIQVLDIAVKPEIKYKPFRLLIVIIAGIIGLIFGILIAFIRERDGQIG